MNIDEMTVGQIKEVAKIANGLCGNSQDAPISDGLNSMIGKKVIIRTYSAGVHYGELIEKAGTEVILKDSRRLWQWYAKKSISLSGVAKYGVKKQSKIAPAVDRQWLDAIEIIPCTEDAIKSIEEQKDVEAS